ncbi:MAG: acylneuraminate cytidylyltransferase family protein [Myxococcales bacterium]|nr:acylneuraminate cytidylyltransferase family protein [Myxococcales bacterium]
MRQYCALVPMKGHSERVPDKNVRTIAGKPLCLWVIETLLSLPTIHRVVVNTDSDRISEIVSGLDRVAVHQRPTELCGDFVSMNRIIEHDLSLQSEFEHFVQTHSTNPLLSSDTLGGALAAFSQQDQFDSVFSVTRHQARFFDKDGLPINHDPAVLARTQDLPPVYEENSNFYVFTRSSFAATSQRIGVNPMMWPMDKLEAVDIDEPADWELAELLLKRRSTA